MQNNLKSAEERQHVMLSCTVKHGWQFVNLPVVSAWQGACKTCPAVHVRSCFRAYQLVLLTQIQASIRMKRVVWCKCATLWHQKTQIWLPQQGSIMHA
eukprot:1139847-Pelagomonas_calceolata.AAC.8